MGFSVSRLAAFLSFITGHWTAIARSTVVVRVVISVLVMNMIHTTINNSLVVGELSSLR